MKTLIVGHPHPNLVEMVHNHLMDLGDNIKLDIIQPEISLPVPANHPLEHLPMIEIKATKMEPCNDPCAYVPMPKKGIGQKAQWASKPHKRKRK